MQGKFLLDSLDNRRKPPLASGSLLDLRRECEFSPWRVLFSHLYSFAFLEARLGDPHFCVLWSIWKRWL